MPRDDKGQKVVAQFAIAHPAARFGVGARPQKVQKIRHRARPRTRAGADGGIGDPLHAPHLATGAEQPAGARDPAGQAQDIHDRHPRRAGHIGVDGGMNRIAVEPLAPRQGDIGDHLEGGADGFLEQINRAIGGGGQPTGAGLGGGGHHRTQRLDMALGKGGRGGQTLPAPMRALGDEQRLADRGE